MGAIHLSRTVSFQRESLQTPQGGTSQKKLRQIIFWKISRIFFKYQLTLVVGGELGGMIFLFGSVRVTNPNCWCFILFVFSASKTSGVLKNPIPVLPWSHYSCTFFKMSSFEQKSNHKNQHESSLSATIFCWDGLRIFQKSPPFHGFLRFFNRKKFVLPKWSNFSPPNSSKKNPIAKKVKLLWLFGPIARFQFIDQ